MGLSPFVKPKIAIAVLFLFCRGKNLFLYWFERQKGDKRIRIKQRKAHGPPRILEQYNIIYRILHQYNKRESFIRAHTKPPQSCEERKPAPPNEEQFKAPTTGGHAMSPIAAVLTSRSNSKKRTGTDKITANSRSSSGKGQMLFERCSSCCCYCVKSEFFCPRWLNEKLFASNNRRTKDVACDS